MALASSPLSQVCKSICDHVSKNINGPNRSQVRILLSNPAEAASAGAGESIHRLNLFFYRFEPAGLFPDTLPGETGWLRAFCLFTPFAAEESPISSGENDLRLIGEVVRIFHEQPVFSFEADGKKHHLQFVFLPLGLDQLNQLWSTQGDAIYRPSVLYEISLIPVVPAALSATAPLVVTLDLEAQGSADRHLRASGQFGRWPQMSAVMHPDTRNEDWAPAIAFILQDGSCALSLFFVVGSQEVLNFAPRVLVAGEKESTVLLCWETWKSETGWKKEPNPTTFAIVDQAIDPDAPSQASTAQLTLPSPSEPGQRLLYAERTFTRRVDGIQISVRSNPLLVTLGSGQPS